MEAAAGRGGTLPVSSSSSSQPLRKEWRAVSEHSFRSNGSEESEHLKLGQSDERTIYEAGGRSLDMKFCSITIDGVGLSDDSLQQRLHDIVRQREELMQMEIGLRAQAIARTEIMEVQSSYEAQIKEQASAAAKLKEQLQDREEYIHDLELKMEEKDRELHAMNNEAAWAKEDFLREQNEKLANFRREHDSSEAEKAQHVKQIRDLQEHIKEKDSQFLALEEQHRVAQETILYKDDQLREAQAWIARVQEMGVLQSTTNQSLQAELRERTEQFNHYYVGLQRQFADMERHHLQAIQQLQVELAEAREHNGIYKDGSQVAHGSSMDPSLYVPNKRNLSVDDGVTSNGNSCYISNGKLDETSTFGSSSNASMKPELVPGVPVVPSSIVGAGAFLPAGQMNSLPAETVIAHSEELKSHIGQQQISDHAIKQSKEEVQVFELTDNQYQTSPESQQILNDDNAVPAERQLKEQALISGQRVSDVALSASQDNVVGIKNAEKYNVNPLLHLPEGSLQSARTSISPVSGKAMEPHLLDERSLLACIVRTIPAGLSGGIRISATLPNRLGKMLAPLHWHDYKKLYGKLDDFVGHHPELFVIQGDFIHLREGAQEIISATTAVAKVAAAAAASSTPYSTLLPSVAVTPVAQSNRHKKALATYSKPVAATHTEGAVLTRHGANNTQPNDTSLNVVQGISDADSSRKLKHLQDVNGLSEIRSDQSSAQVTIQNGTNVAKAAYPPSQSKGLSNGRHGLGGRRSSGVGSISR